MAVQIPPQQQIEFHGVYTLGNPSARPRGTSAVCKDFRIMPGFWLRTAGGRRARYNIPNALNSLRIIPYRDPHYPGSSNHIIQINYSSGGVQWTTFANATFQPLPSPFQIETISTTYDASFSTSNPAAGCLLSDRPMLYNGLGVRDGSGSRPAFSTSYQSVTRYYGLDGYCPSATPSVAFAAGAGNNQVLTSVTIYVGLYNSTTAHYGNPVKAGTITTTGATGTITVSGLGNLPVQYHNTIEQNELKYVFYATVDGGQVAYLILNSGLTGPYTANSNAASASLSIASGTFNGWVLDLTKEAPYQNFPPRPMRSVCFVNGRVYGCLLEGGSGSGTDFSYVPANKDLAAVVWSQAASDSARQNVVGDPNQCFPLTNIAYTPSADAPLAVVPAQDNVRVLVLTPTSSFLLQEVADGVHEYITISRKHGLYSAGTIAETPYGIVWVTQRKEIVLLSPYSTKLQILSDVYQSLISGTPKAADWVYDPTEQIDRYQLWMDNGVAIIHDFALGDGAGSGEAYTRTNQPTVGCAATVLDGSGTSSFIIAGTGVYTHETQPDTGLVPTTDQTFTTGQSFSTQEINGEYDRNWDAFGDANLRKSVQESYLIADGATSTQLGASPLTVEWYADFQQVTGANKHAATVQKTPQSDTDYNWMAKFATATRFWFKFVLKIAGHSTDDATFANHVNWAQQGDLAKNFYGSILQFLLLLKTDNNRS